MYTPHKWQTREIIYAAQLNNIEGGVQQSLDNIKEETKARATAVTAEKERAQNVERGLSTSIEGLEEYKHTHPNKSVIDSISQADIDYWNSGGGGGGGGGAMQIHGTLLAGETTVEMSSAMIANASRIELYTSTGIAPLSQSVSGSVYTAVFEEQETDIDVMIEVRANVDDMDDT